MWVSAFFGPPCIWKRGAAMLISSPSVWSGANRQLHPVLHGRSYFSITFHHPASCIKLYCLLIEAQTCKQLALSCYSTKLHHDTEFNSWPIICSQTSKPLHNQARNEPHSLMRHRHLVHSSMLSFNCIQHWHCLKLHHNSELMSDLRKILYY